MSDEAHVVPRGDQIEHQTTEDCVCVPRCDPVERADGSMGWVYIHHSLDGREIDDWGSSEPTRDGSTAAAAAYAVSATAGVMLFLVLVFLVISHV